MSTIELRENGDLVITISGDCKAAERYRECLDALLVITQQQDDQYCDTDTRYEVLDLVRLLLPSGDQLKKALRS